MTNKENISAINDRLKNTLALVKDINRSEIRPGQTSIQRNLEEELKINRLTSNDPD